MRAVLAALMALCAAGAHSEPVRESVLTVQWHEAYGAPEVRDGVCHVYSLGRDDRELTELDAQAEFCIRHPGMSVSGAVPPGAIRVRWREVGTALHMHHLHKAHYPGPIRGTAVTLRGFYVLAEGEFHIYTRAKFAAFGHELMHHPQYRGKFHDDGGKWCSRGSFARSYD